MGAPVGPISNLIRRRDLYIVDVLVMLLFLRWKIANAELKLCYNLITPVSP